MQGFLRCDGAIYTRTAYPALAAYIGTPVLAAPAINTYTNASLTINSYFGGANNILATTGTASAPSSGVAGSGGLFTSADGTTWTSRTAWNLGTFYNTASYYQQLFVYNNGVYLASTNCASGAYIQYSSDLATWNKSAIYVGSGNSTWYVYGVCAGGTSNVFVSQAGGDNGCTGGSSGLVYSTNGSSWTQATLPAPITHANFGWLDGAGYSGGVVLSVSYFSSGWKYRYIYSATGTSYTDVSMGSAESARIISYANGRFIAGTSDGKLYTSTTGAGGTWSLTASPGTSIAQQKIYWNGTAYVATNGYYSLDLITWFNGTSAITTQANNKLWYRSGTSFYYWDFNAYTTATQFPVPSLGIGQYNMPSSGFSNYAYYIKT
jgi:hypothetical protein